MGNTLRSLKRAVQAEVEAAKQPIPEQARYKVGDRIVRCSQCGGDKFIVGPPFAPLFVGVAIECVSCSHLELFGKDVLIAVSA
jgi:hypothetical protein